MPVSLGNVVAAADRRRAACASPRWREAGGGRREMGRWQCRRGHSAAARTAPVGLIVAVVLAAASIAGCAQRTSPSTPARWRRRPALLGAWAWATVLALTLSACTGLALPPAGPTPTPTPTPVPTPVLPRGCSYGGGRGIQPTF